MAEQRESLKGLCWSATLVKGSRLLPRAGDREEDQHFRTDQNLSPNLAFLSFEARPHGVQAGHHTASPGRHSPPLTLALGDSFWNSIL